MSKSVLDAKHFHDERVAFAYLEARLWPNGPICPHCGGTEHIGKLKGKSTRIGVYKCYQCRKPFRVTVGTVFKSSHIPVRLWLQAVHLMAASKKGISSNELHRVLGVSLKAAWFISHRIREAMRSADLAPMGGAGRTVEVDETFIGHDQTKKPKGQKKGCGYAHKYKVLSLVDRETAQARSVVVDDLKASTLVPILCESIAAETKVMTDEAGQYKYLGRDFPHEFVSHNKGEYGRGPIHTNTIEAFFSIFKRGMKGVYQHCAKEHLHRYLAEFDSRYSNRVRLGVDDVERADRVLAGIAGKRLTYRTTGSREAT